MKKFLAFLLLIGTFSAFSAEVRVQANAVEFTLNKDLDVDTAELGVRCLRSATIWEQLNNGLDEYTDCYKFMINGVPAYKAQPIELKKVGKNKFVLNKDVLINYSTSRKGHVCLTVRAGFRDYSIQFKQSEDYYSLLSYCTVDKLPFRINETIYNNKRVSTLEKFNDALGRPIEVDLK